MREFSQNKLSKLRAVADHRALFNLFFSKFNENNERTKRKKLVIAKPVLPSVEITI